MGKNERLRELRVKAGYGSASDAARAMGVAIPTYSHHENGTRDFNLETAKRYATFFRGNLLHLALGPSRLDQDQHDGEPHPQDILTELESSLRATMKEIAPPVPNATIGEEVTTQRRRIPVLGEGVAGTDGRFVMNGQKIADVLAPPSLEGVRNAYAVYIHGDSMSPRYEAGEIVFVNPFRPVRSGQYVVAQIAAEAEGEPPFAYVKRFVSMNSGELLLEQLNPGPGEDAIMRFPREVVASLHLIVGSAEG